MYKTVPPLTTLLWLLANWCLLVAADDFSSDGQKAILGRTVKALLNVRQNPSDSTQPPPPQLDLSTTYMKKIFERYRRDGANGSLYGNIVRSIKPKISRSVAGSFISYNLSSVGSTESILRAEIHFNLKSKKQLAKEHKRHHSTLKCFVLMPHTGSQLELHMKDSLADWTSFDAMPIVQSVMKRSSHRGQFEVAFGRQRHDGRLKVFHNDRVVRQHQPFLLVFSDDSDMANKEGLKSLLDETEPLGTDEDELMQTRAKRDLQKNPAYYAYAVDASGNRQSEPNDKWRNQVDRFGPNKGPKVLVERKSQPKGDGQKKLIPKGRYYHPTKFGKVGKKQKERNFPFAWLQRPLGLNGDAPEGIYLKSQHHMDVCRKRDLIVEFSDIGWGDWIISPKSFEAHFCSGSCPFPLTKDSNPTNHAMIQTIINRIGLHPNVPTPCCAPDKMDSLTLLYFDDEQNVVLKNYPKMTVKSCGCL